MKKQASNSVALEAHAAIHGVKRKAYGPVEQSFDEIAALLNIVLPGKSLVGKDIAKIMLCLKLYRESVAHSRDNCLDLCGYADLLQQLHDADEAA